MDARRTIEPPAYAGMIRRCLKAMGKRAAEHDPESLRLFADLRQAVDDAEHAAIAGLIDAGYSWREMGRALGMSHVAVYNRFNRYQEAGE